MVNRKSCCTQCKKYHQKQEEIDTDYGVLYFCSPLCKFIWAKENDFDDDMYEAITKMALECDVFSTNDMIRAVLKELNSLMKDDVGINVCISQFGKELFDLKLKLNKVESDNTRLKKERVLDKK